MSSTAERSSSLALLKSLDPSRSSSSAKRAREEASAKGQGDESLVNTRKAVRFESGGRGSAGMVKSQRGGKSARGRGGKRGRK